VLRIYKLIIYPDRPIEPPRKFAELETTPHSSLRELVRRLYLCFFKVFRMSENLHGDFVGDLFLAALTIFPTSSQDLEISYDSFTGVTPSALSSEFRSYP
jgi:hypothetical protein